MSYYEKWAAKLTEQLVKYELATRVEIESGIPSSSSPRRTPPLTRAAALTLITHGSPASRDVPATARFQKGQSVRARNLNPICPTRLPLDLDRVRRGGPSLHRAVEWVIISRFGSTVFCCCC